MKSEVQVQLGAAAVIWGEDVRLQVISSLNQVFIVSHRVVQNNPRGVPNELGSHNIKNSNYLS